MGSDWAASALTWWQEAGVDTVVGEEPRNWLAPAPKPSAAAAEPVPAAAPMPQTLDAFQIWLRDSRELPFASPTAPRVGPSGSPASGLMILVDMPSVEDVAAIPLGEELGGQPRIIWPGEGVRPDPDGHVLVGHVWGLFAGQSRSGRQLPHFLPRRDLHHLFPGPKTLVRCIRRAGTHD